MKSSDLPTEQWAIQFDEPGGVEVIKRVKVPVPQPSEHQVLVKVEWCGINFIDTYFRSGLYPVSLPFTLGNEPAGTVVKLGSKATGFSLGDRVTFYFRGSGLQEYTTCPASRAFKIPDSVSTRDAAGISLQGLTALTFVREAHHVQKGEYILVHAAAGGLGTMLCQILSHLGAHVIGTTSTEAKARIAKENGATDMVLYQGRDMKDVVSDIKKLTPGGEGVAAVFDGVGHDTWESNFEVVKRKGTIVCIGNASGPPPHFSVLKLMAKNLKLCRPALDHYVETPEEWQSYASELFELVNQKVVRPAYYKPQGYAFTEEEIRQAHLDLASRKTTGKLIVKVSE